MSLIPDAPDVSCPRLVPPPKKCKLSKAARNLDNNHLYSEIQRRALSNRLLKKESAVKKKTQNFGRIENGFHAALRMSC